MKILIRIFLVIVLLIPIHSAFAVRNLKLTPFRIAAKSTWTTGIVIRIYIDVVNISNVPQTLTVKLKNVDLYMAVYFDTQLQGQQNLPAWTENIFYPNVRSISGSSIPNITSTRLNVPINASSSQTVYFSIACHIQASTSSNFVCQMNDESFLAGLLAVPEAKTIETTAKFELEAEVTQDRGAILMNVQTEFQGTPVIQTTREANGGRAF